MAILLPLLQAINLGSEAAWTGFLWLRASPPPPLEPLVLYPPLVGLLGPPRPGAGRATVRELGGVMSENGGCHETRALTHASGFLHQGGVL
jgi:hypothetical protein